MTSVTTTQATARQSGVPLSHRPKMTWAGLMRSEWIKLVTTRSTLWTLLASGFVMVMVASVASASSTGSVSDPNPQGGGPGFGGSGPLDLILAGQTPLVLVMGVLGVMLGAREYASGLVRTTYAAVPKRLPVLVSRIVVFASAAFAVVGIGTVIAFFTGNAILTAGDAATVAWGDDGVLRAVAGTVAYLVGIGVMGICIGTVTRTIGSGVGIVIGLILVLPGLGRVLLPESWADGLKYLPSDAGTAFAALDAGGDYLSIGVGSVVFVLWVVAGALAASVALLRRDV
jgi:ABC-2 type transport system permease protein